MPDDPSGTEDEVSTAHTVVADDTSSRDASARRSQPAIVGARFQLGEPIGHGGMGEVLAARDTQLDRDVAIKRMRASDPNDRQIARFLREARVQGQLEHPAIPPVHELGRDGSGRPYFAMKKLAGVTLAEVFAGTDARFSRQRLLRAFAEVCLAVEFAHTRGIIHRDVKPENILLGEFGEVYVLDWGVAKLIGETRTADAELVGTADDGVATIAGQAIGTPGYMPPEQLQGESDVDARADVYALGCVLFEILAGEPLHPRGRAAVFATLDDGPGEGPAARAPDRDVPPELDAACVHATARTRDARIASARELGERVQHYLDGDRDVAMRQRLAATTFAQATAAFLADDRVAAMRNAARALALDATLAGPGELITRLMLEPPREPPAEVTAALAADAVERFVGHTRIAFAGYLGYCAFLPLMFARAPLGVACALLAVLATTMTYAWQVAFRRRILPIAGFAVLNAVLIGMVARAFSPIAFTPTLAAITGLVLALNPMWRRLPRLTIFAAMFSAVAVPWLLEIAHIASTTMAIDDGGLRVFAAGLVGSRALTVAAVAGSVAITIGIAVIVAHRIERSETETRRRLHLQAWQLRQLVA
jgi:tRNA A-37 threonylcarbamoyl transferase component Bud32